MMRCGTLQEFIELITAEVRTMTPERSESFVKLGWRRLREKSGREKYDTTKL